MSRLGHILTLFKSDLIKVKAAFRHQRWKEVLIFSFFLLLAIGFWLLQSLQQEYEIKISIPLNYKQISPEIAFVTVPPEEITVKIKDKGSVLLNYTIGHRFMPIDVTPEDMRKNNLLFVSRKRLEEEMQKQLISTTLIEDFEPQQIELKYGKLQNKKLPVVFDGNIRTETGYQVSGEITITPSEVIAFASDAVLDTLRNVKTIPLEVEKANTTIVKTLKLVARGEVRFQPSTVTIKIPIEEYTEKTLDIPIRCTNLPLNYTLRTFPSVTTITCYVPLSNFKKLSPDDFEISVPFEELEDNVSGTVPITLTGKPDWVRMPEISPNKVEFILEQKQTIAP